MRMIKVTTALNENDFDDEHYILLFDENKKFIGIIWYVDDHVYIRTTSDTCICYASLEHLLSHYENGIIKIVSKQELNDLLISLL